MSLLYIALGMLGFSMSIYVSEMIPTIIRYIQTPAYKRKHISSKTRQYED